MVVGARRESPVVVSRSKNNNTAVGLSFIKTIIPSSEYDNYIREKCL